MLARSVQDVSSKYSKAGIFLEINPLACFGLKFQKWQKQVTKMFSGWIMGEYRGARSITIFKFLLKKVNPPCTFVLLYLYAMRIYFYAKDYMLLSGKNEKTAYTFLRTLRDALGKKEHQPVTILEYCKYEGIDPAEVINKLML